MLRRTSRVAAIAAGLIACVPLHYAWRLFGRPSPWPRIFLGGVGHAAGMRVRTIGTPLTRDVLFLANHSSWLDIMLVAGTTGASFVSMAEVASWPLFGWLAGLHRTIFVERTQRSAVHGQAAALRAALAEGRPVALFPEGTTEGGTDVLPFRASLIAAAFPPLPRLKVQPVAIDFGAVGREIAWVGGEPGGDNVRRVLSRRGTTPVSIHFLPAIDPAEAGDRKVLAATARARIVAALEASARSGDPL